MLTLKMCLISWGEFDSRDLNSWGVFVKKLDEFKEDKGNFTGISDFNKMFRTRRLYTLRLSLFFQHAFLFCFVFFLFYFFLFMG